MRIKTPLINKMFTNEQFYQMNVIFYKEKNKLLLENASDLKKLYLK